MTITPPISGDGMTTTTAANATSTASSEDHEARTGIDVPVTIPADLAAHPCAEAPAGAPADTPVTIAADDPADVPVTVPAGVPHLVPVDSPVDTQIEVEVGLAVDLTGEAPAPSMLTGTSETWSRYRATRCPEARNQLVLQYSPLVKYVAGRVRSGLPASVESADLVSEGIFGLMDAIERFDPARGWAFQTYAVPRIRGAIIDSIRAGDWVPRSVRAQLRDLDAARAELHRELNRTPTDAEVAARLRITLRALRALASRPTQMGSAGEDEVGALSDTAAGIEEALEDEGTRAVLMQAVRTLPQRDQVVIALYFFEGLTLAEIGQVLGVSESRVSQLRTRTCTSLRTTLATLLAA